MNRTTLLLVGAIVVGALLRFIFLGSIPTGFTPDEASQAYSAYSILKTGKDEWGNSYPLASFKSFLDYKAPLQTYLMVPSIALFGLNESAARVPSSLFGVLAIIAVYLLCLELFPGRKAVGLVAACILSISPWHLQFSRMALEVNLTSFLFPMGLYFFLKGLKESRYLAFSVLFFGFSLYAYHAARVFIPLFGITLLLLYSKKIFTKGYKPLIVPILLVFLFVSPIFFDIFFGGSAKRGGDVMITNLNDVKIKEINTAAYFSDLNKINPKLSHLFHNRYSTLITQYTENYLSYFSLPFWFTESGRETTYSIIPGRGLLYFWQLPLVLFGLFLLFSKKNISFDNKILIAWLILGAIPAALTKEGYRPNRAGSYLVFWEIITAIGLVSFIEIKFKLRNIFLSLYFVVSVILVLFYFEDYFFNSKITFPKSLSYGWRDALSFVRSRESNYLRIMIDHGTQPQSFVAFYNKVNPKDFRTSSLEWEADIKKSNYTYLDQMGRYHLGKYVFERLDWPDDRDIDTLYLYQGNSGSLNELPADRRVLYEIKEPLGNIIMEVFDFKK